MASMQGNAPMAKGFCLEYGYGKTAQIWQQNKGGGLSPGQAMVLLPPAPNETKDSPVAYIAPLRRVLAVDNKGHIAIFVSKPDYVALKSGVFLNLH